MGQHPTSTTTSEHRGEVVSAEATKRPDSGHAAAKFQVRRSTYTGGTSSASPLGALADLLTAAVNPNVAKWKLAPVASEIESQTICWRVVRTHPK